MNYITSLQAAKKWNISQRRVAVLCAQNRIRGVIKAGKTWLIPSDCEKPKDGRTEGSFEYNIESGDMCVSEPSDSYCIKTELLLNPYLVEESKALFEKTGKTLSEGINEYLKRIVSEKNKDCMASYPQGFFDLFGSAPDLDFPDNINDLIAEKVEL